MSKEELYKALKLFDREDLTYENDVFCNNFEEYMKVMEQEKSIEVFMSTKDMIKYCKLGQEIERLHSIIKEVRECINKKLNINSDYVDYDFGTELLRQELLGILDKVGEINESR